MNLKENRESSLKKGESRWIFKDKIVLELKLMRIRLDDGWQRRMKKAKEAEKGKEQMRGKGKIKYGRE